MTPGSEYQNGRCASGWVINAPAYCSGHVTDPPCASCGESAKAHPYGIPACMMDDPPSHYVDENGRPR